MSDISLLPGLFVVRSAELAINLTVVFSWLLHNAHYWLVVQWLGHWTVILL